MVTPISRVRRQEKHGTAAEWTAANTVLRLGEIGYETDTNKFKFGDGNTGWNSLNYFPQPVKLSTYADFAVAVSAIGSTKAVLEIDTTSLVSSAQTIPSTLLLKADGGLLTKSGSGSIQFQGIGIDNPNSQTPLFSGFAAGDITWSGSSYPGRICASLWAGDAATAWNAASRALLGKRVTIDVYPATISSQVALQQYHTLRPHRGTYTMDTTNNSGSILLKDNTRVIGDGWDTIFIETDTTTHAGAWTTVFGAYANTLSVPPANLGNTEISRDLHISDIQFYGLRTNINDGGSQATINFGNAHGFSIRRCWFNSTTGYAANLGGNASNGYAAQDGWFTDNLVENLFVQYLGIINVENLHIEHNEFKNPGRQFTVTNASNTSPIVIATSEANHMRTGDTAVVGRVVGNTAANGTFTITKIDSTHFSLNGSTGNGAYTSGGIAAVQSTGVMVDVEPNGDPVTERIYNVSISNNLFDLRDTAIGFNAISYNITASGLRNAGGKIVNNIILGHSSTALMPLYNGISVSNYATDVEVIGNYIIEGSQSGMTIGGTRVTVAGNTLRNAGFGGNHSIIFSDLVNSTVQGNVITGGAATGWEERGTCTNNTFSNNVLGDGTTQTRILHYTGSTVTGSRYIGNVVYGSTSSGITETTNSNSNLYDNNITNPVGGGNTGLTTVGASSKVVLHKYTDGTSYFGSATQVPTIELGNASDTTISRAAAGRIAVEGVNIPTISSTDTLTNKRITPRVASTASSGTPTPNADTDDVYALTALATNPTFTAPTGTPTNGQPLILSITDNGTPRTLAWNAAYTSTGVSLPTTTVASQTLFVTLRYNSATSKWNCVEVSASGGIAGATGATDNAILRADGAGGGTLQNSPVTIDDDGQINVPDLKFLTSLTKRMIGYSSGGPSIFINPDNVPTINIGGTSWLFQSSGPTTQVGISSGKLSTYNAINTVSNGVPAEYATVDLTAQGAAISATTLYAVPASGAGMYRISFVAKITRAATTSSTLGGANGFRAIYTDQDDSVVVTTGNASNVSGATLTGNSTQVVYAGSMIVNAKASTNIQYSFDYTSSGATTMQFNLHIKVEAL